MAKFDADRDGRDRTRISISKVADRTVYLDSWVDWIPLDKERANSSAPGCTDIRGRAER